MAEKLVPFSLRLPIAAAAELDQMAERSGMTKSELLRLLVEEALAARADDPEEPETVSFPSDNRPSDLAFQVTMLQGVVARLTSWTPPAPALPPLIAELARKVDRLLAEPHPRLDTEPIQSSLEAIGRTVDDSAEQLGSLALRQAELAGLPDHLERLTRLLKKHAAPKEEGVAGELHALREQIASMLAILHMYRTNGTDEAAEGFARKLFD